MQKTNLGLANEPEHSRVLAVFFTPTNCRAPIPCSLNEITQIIRRADSSTRVQLSPTHTERTSKDFRHGIPPKFVNRMLDENSPTKRTSLDFTRYNQKDSQA